MSAAAVGTMAPWQSRIYTQLEAALAWDHLGHALLFSGPPRLGKRDVSVALAHRVLCETPRDHYACGTCRSCRLLAAGTHPDFRAVGFINNREGTRLRTEIVIDQMRELGQQMALTPQFGRAQVAILDPADAINHAAANALLKTLEEPVPGRYLWLIASHPSRLPATISSRCQRVEFRLPHDAESRAWLAARGHVDADAEAALRAARGHPGTADDWLRTGGMALRRSVADDLARLASGEALAQELAQRWAADDHAATRLEHAAELAVEMATGLTAPPRARSLAAWFDKANRSRALLRTTVRADLVLMELLMAWRAIPRPAMEKSDR